MNRSRGFTLIELLVVIAIIGVLSSIVLASLNIARDNGIDSSIKSNMNSFHKAAAFYYDRTGAWTTTPAVGNFGPTTGGCVVSNVVFSDPEPYRIILAINKAGGSAICGATSGATRWVLYSPLRNPPAGTTGWCVDSTGISKASVAPSSPTYVCP